MFNNDYAYSVPRIKNNVFFSPNERLINTVYKTTVCVKLVKIHEYKYRDETLLYLLKRSGDLRLIQK